MSTIVEGYLILRERLKKEFESGRITGGVEDQPIRRGKRVFKRSVFVGEEKAKREVKIYRRMGIGESGG